MPRGGIRRTPELLEKVRALYETGWSTARIGEEIGIHPTTVLKWLDRARVPLRPKFFPEVKDSWVADRVRSGSRWVDLSAETGMSVESLRKRYLRWQRNQIERDQT